MNINYATLYNDSFDAVTGDFEQIAKFLSNTQGSKVLEIGAGSGRLLPIYTKFNFEFYLLDSSREMLEILNKKIELSGSQQFKTFHGYSYSLPFDDNYFDSILIPYAAISEMSPLIFTLSECQRVLKPGGNLYFLDINPYAFSTSASGLERTSQLGSQHSLSAETFPTQGKGHWFFEVHFENRGVGDIQKYIVEQVHPPFPLWEKLLRLTGFEIIEKTGNFKDDDFDETTSPLLKIVSRKVSEYESTSSNNSLVVSKVYDSMAPKYEAIASGEHYKVPTWFKDKIVKYKGRHPVVLDVGCATGSTGKWLKEVDITPCFLHGIDVSREMIRNCREQKLYSSVALWDLQNGFVEPKFMLFDVITAIGVLEFLDNPIELLKDLRNSLKIGGEIYLTFEKSYPLQETTVFNLSFGVLKKSAYLEEDVKSLVNGAGLKIIGLDEGEAYISPSTNEQVYYWHCHARRTSL